MLDQRLNNEKVPFLIKQKKKSKRLLLRVSSSFKEKKNK